MPEISFDAQKIRRAVFMNLVTVNSPLKESDLTVDDIITLVQEAGYFIMSQKDKDRKTFYARAEENISKFK